MAYFAPYIDAAGLHIPTYNDVLDDLMEKFKGIYGQDVYLETDSSDYQWISVVALKDFDCLQTLQLIYNNRSPQTSIGAALSSIVKLNGLKRKAASYSTCVVTITGTDGTTINNGIVKDIKGNLWTLPVVMTIGVSGTIDVTVIGQTIGAITALPADINIISTPQAGWTSVTNAGAASPGQPIETDTRLKERQSMSTEKPSTTMLSGTASSIASLPGVTRSKVYENKTGATDSNGLPAHSLTALVEGGINLDIATAIYENRGIGPLTNGTTHVNVTDAITGQVMSIGFYRQTNKSIDVVLQVHDLSGYTSATGDTIKQAVADYLNGYDIGASLAVNSLYGPALSAMDSTSNPLYYVRSINACLHGGAPAGTDIAIAFNEVTTCEVANITINLV